jgi:mono/diheme cytochrome c family protein
MRSALPACVILLLLSSRCFAEAPSYAKDIAPFLKTYCVSCHQGARPKAGVDLSSYEALLRATRRGRTVAPGEPDKSRLLLTMTGKGKPMPPRKEKQPTAAEIDLIRTWIKEGARKDAAATPGSALPASAENRRPVAFRRED